MQLSCILVALRGKVSLRIERRDAILSHTRLTWTKRSLPEDTMAGNEISAGLAVKVIEYRMMSAPLQQAMSELEHAQSMLMARAESDIAQTVPALGALADILD